MGFLVVVQTFSVWRVCLWRVCCFNLAVHFIPMLYFSYVEGFICWGYCCYLLGGPVVFLCGVIAILTCGQHLLGVSTLKKLSHSPY
jgi:hypothetical protein